MNSPLRQDANRCFVCGPANPIGLQLTFTLDGDVCRTAFTPGENHAGYDRITHGGILFSVLDDVMANYLYLQGHRCYTARSDLRYRQPLPLGTRVLAEAWCEKRKTRLAQMQGRLIREDTNEVVVEASGSFIIIPD